MTRFHDGKTGGRGAPGLAALGDAYGDVLRLATRQARAVSPAAGEAVRRRFTDAILAELARFRAEAEANTTTTTTTTTTGRNTTRPTGPYAGSRAHPRA